MQPVERRPPIQPMLVLAFGILAVSFGSIFIRQAQEYAASLVIAAYRLTFATLVITPIALTRNRGELASLKRNQLLLAALSGLLLALHFATWTSSLEFTTVASSVVLVSTTPLWVALFSPLFLKEPVTRPVVIGMTLALVGAVTIGLSDACAWENGRLTCPAFTEFVQGKAFLGDLLALLGAIMGAGYVMIGRKLRPGISLMGYIFLVYGVAALGLVILMLASGESPVGYPSQAYLWFLLLAIFPQLLGHSSFNYALGYLSAAYVSITLLGEPICATILAYFLLNEIPTPVKIFGAILILAGIYIASRAEAQKTG